MLMILIQYDASRDRKRLITDESETMSDSAQFFKA